MMCSAVPWVWIAFGPLITWVSLITTLRSEPRVIVVFAGTFTGYELPPMLRFRNVVEVAPSSLMPVVVLSAAAYEVLSIASTLIAPLNRFRPAIRTREAILTPLPSEPGLVQREAV